MRYWIGFIGIMALVAIAGAVERGYFDYLGLATLCVLAVPVAKVLKGVR